MLAGPAFSADDLGAANAVIVNETFAQKLLDSSEAETRAGLADGISTGTETRSALGVRFRNAVRYTGTRAPSSWYQIIGVIRDFPSQPHPAVSNGRGARRGGGIG